MTADKTEYGPHRDLEIHEPMLGPVHDLCRLIARKVGITSDLLLEFKLEIDRNGAHLHLSYLDEQRAELVKVVEDFELRGVSRIATVFGNDVWRSMVDRDPAEAERNQDALRDEEGEIKYGNRPHEFRAHETNRSVCRTCWRNKNSWLHLPGAVTDWNTAMNVLEPFAWRNAYANLKERWNQHPSSEEGQSVAVEQEAPQQEANLSDSPERGQESGESQDQVTPSQEMILTIHCWRCSAENRRDFQDLERRPVAGRYIICSSCMQHAPLPIDLHSVPEYHNAGLTPECPNCPHGAETFVPHGWTLNYINCVHCGALAKLGTR